MPKYRGLATVVFIPFLSEERIKYLTIYMSTMMSGSKTTSPMLSNLSVLGHAQYPTLFRLLIAAVRFEPQSLDCYGGPSNFALCIAIALVLQNLVLRRGQSWEGRLTGHWDQSASTM